VRAYIPAFDRRMPTRNMVQWDAIGYDGSDCSVRYFDVPPISMDTFVVKYVYNNASSPGVPNYSF